MHIVALHRAADETPSLDERPVAVASAERGCGEDVNIWSSVRRQRRCAVSLAAEDADRSPIRPTPGALRHEFDQSGLPTGSFSAQNKITKHIFSLSPYCVHVCQWPQRLVLKN
jgi:hypothetical protein